MQEQPKPLNNNIDIKEKLFNLGIIDNNDYFEKYIRLIIDNEQTKKQKYKTQQHHIIPKCYYKRNNLEVDNSSDNLINLLYKDHILAHYYLCMCVQDENIKHDCILAFTYLTDRIDSLKETAVHNLKIEIEYSREQIVQQLPMFQELYEQAKKTHGENMKGHIPWNKGLKNPVKLVSVNDGTITKRIPETELQAFLDEGWQRGRHDQKYISAIISSATKGKEPPNKGGHLTDEQKQHLRQINLGKKQSTTTIEKRRQKLMGHIVSEETRQRIKESNLGKIRSDETRCHISESKKGKSPPNKGKPMSEEQKQKISQTKKGMLWITDGVNNKMIKSEEYMFYENLGFYKGRTITQQNDCVLSNVRLEGDDNETKNKTRYDE